MSDRDAYDRVVSAQVIELAPDMEWEAVGLTAKARLYVALLNLCTDLMPVYWTDLFHLAQVIGRTVIGEGDFFFSTSRSAAYLTTSRVEAQAVAAAPEGNLYIVSIRRRSSDGSWRAYVTLDVNWRHLLSDDTSEATDNDVG